MTLSWSLTVITFPSRPVVAGMGHDLGEAGEHRAAERDHVAARRVEAADDTSRPKPRGDTKVIDPPAPARWMPSPAPSPVAPPASRRRGVRRRRSTWTARRAIAARTTPPSPPCRGRRNRRRRRWWRDGGLDSDRDRKGDWPVTTTVSVPSPPFSFSGAPSMMRASLRRHRQGWSRRRRHRSGRLRRRRRAHGVDAVAADQPVVAVAAFPAGRFRLRRAGHWPRDRRAACRYGRRPGGSRCPGSCRRRRRGRSRPGSPGRPARGRRWWRSWPCRCRRLDQGIRPGAAVEQVVAGATGRIAAGGTGEIVPAPPSTVSSSAPAG